MFDVQCRAVIIGASMRDRIIPGKMPRFWAPRPSRLWMRLLRPVHRRMLRNHHAVKDVRVEGMEQLGRLGPADSALICPNHSYTGDGHVRIDVGFRAPRPFYFMAAWHVFRGHAGIDGWLLQRWGGFSVDREGCDRRAMKMAIDLLAGGRFLVIFPEGEVYHLNERLTPLREGVAFLAASAQRELDRAGGGGRVLIFPTAIRYQFIEDVTPRLEAALAALEKRVMLKAPAGMPLHERIVRFGEVMLTIKEKEKLGRSREHEADLRSRIGGLIEDILTRREREHLNKSNSSDTIPVRVKLLRRKLLEPWCDDEAASPDAIPQAVRDALEDVHLALQLYSYPGDYMTTNPTLERMAETIEKFEEDIHGGYARPKGARRATVTIGEPIDVKQQVGAGRARAAAENLTVDLEKRLGAMVSSAASDRPHSDA